jgi:hypothetical protein
MKSIIFVSSSGFMCAIPQGLVNTLRSSIVTSMSSLPKLGRRMRSVTRAAFEKKLPAVSSEEVVAIS